MGNQMDRIDARSPIEIGRDPSEPVGLVIQENNLGARGHPGNERLIILDARIDEDNGAIHSRPRASAVRCSVGNDEDASEEGVRPYASMRTRAIYKLVVISVSISN